MSIEDRQYVRLILAYSANRRLAVDLGTILLSEAAFELECGIQLKMRNAHITSQCPCGAPAPSPNGSSVSRRLIFATACNRTLLGLAQVERQTGGGLYALLDNVSPLVGFVCRPRSVLGSTWTTSIC